MDFGCLLGEASAAKPQESAGQSYSSSLSPSGGRMQIMMIMDPQSPGWPPSLHSSSSGNLGRRQWSNTRQALREQKHETSMPSLFPYCLWDTGESKRRVGRTTRMVARNGQPSTRKIIKSARTLLPTQGIRHLNLEEKNTEQQSEMGRQKSPRHGVNSSAK